MYLNINNSYLSLEEKGEQKKKTREMKELKSDDTKKKRRNKYTKRLCKEEQEKEKMINTGKEMERKVTA